MHHARNQNACRLVVIGVISKSRGGEELKIEVSASAILSPREIDVLSYAAKGLADKQIAKCIQVQPATVRTYWERIRTKLAARNRTHAVCLAIALGHVQLDPAAFPREYTEPEPGEPLASIAC
jgi:DNA-binding CsgD family transcriptional regulator